MIRVSAGHYRDSFCRKVYEVERYSLPLGTKTEKGWSFTVEGVTKTGFSSKEQAAQQARVKIYDIIG